MPERPGTAAERGLKEALLPILGSRNGNSIPERREWSAMSDKSGAGEGLAGVVEGAKGKVKEAAGAVTGRDDLRREGEAQQDKADSQREAAEKEAQAEGARAAADANEAREKSEQ